MASREKMIDDLMVEIETWTNEQLLSWAQDMLFQYLDAVSDEEVEKLWNSGITNFDENGDCVCSECQGKCEHFEDEFDDDPNEGSQCDGCDDCACEANSKKNKLN